MKSRARDRVEEIFKKVNADKLPFKVSPQNLNELGIDIEKVNLDGGALSLGHPLGASGARITCKAASLLQRTGKSKAIATMCIGGGMGIATALERY